MGKVNEVYIVTRGLYDDFEIDSVFLDKSEAEEHSKFINKIVEEDENAKYSSVLTFKIGKKFSKDDVRFVVRINHEGHAEAMFDYGTFYQSDDSDLETVVYEKAFMSFNDDPKDYDRLVATYTTQVKALSCEEAVKLAKEKWNTERVQTAVKKVMSMALEDEAFPIE